MGFQDIDQLYSLDALNQAYRVPGVAPGAVPQANYLGKGTIDDAVGKNNVADELVRVLQFVPADPKLRPYGKQFVVQASEGLADLDYFLAKRAPGESDPGTEWKAGRTTAFGKKLVSSPRRFKKISTVVRTDEMMATGEDDVLSMQLRLASISIIRTLSAGILQSNTADDNHQFSGLPSVIDSDQVVAWDSDSLIWNLSKLERLAHPSDGDFGSGPDAFVMSSKTRWRLLQELEAAGGPDFHECKLTGRRQLHFHGVPVLMGRVKEGLNVANGDSFTDAWAIKLFGPSAVRVLHLGGDSSTYGVRVEKMAVTQTTESGATPSDVANTTAAIEVFGLYSLLIPEQQSIARLKDIPNVDPDPDPTP